MNYWTIYWITRLESIHVLVGISLTALLVVGIVLLIGAFMISTEMEWDSAAGALWKKGFKWSLVALIPTLIIGTFVPSTKEAVAIYIIPKIANNQQVQKLPDNAMKFVNEQLEAWIKDLHKDGKSDGK